MKVSALLLVATLSLSACAKPLPGDPPAPVISAANVLVFVQAAKAAIQVLCGTTDPLAECQPGTIATNVEHELVRDLDSVSAVLRTAGQGWQAAVRASWAQIRPRFDSIVDQRVRLAVNVVTAIVDLLPITRDR